MVDQVPHIALFAVADLAAGQQVLLEYGLRKLPFEDKNRYNHTQCTALLTMSISSIVYVVLTLSF